MCELIRSPKAKRSIGTVLFDNIPNVLNIYVEDHGVVYGKIYTNIFSRIFNFTEVGFKIKIHQLENTSDQKQGGRDEVIKECKRNINTRMKLYVIDGDFYQFKEKDNIPEAKNLFILPYYCIENMLLDTSNENYIEFIDQKSSLAFDELSNSLNINEYMSILESLLLPLFLEYAISFHLETGIKTVSKTVNHLMDKSSESLLSKEKIDAEISNIKESIKKSEKYCESEYIRYRYEFQSIIDHSNSRLRFISGKDFLFYCIKDKLKEFAFCHINDQELKLFLSKKCYIRGDIKESLYNMVGVNLNE
ncbi:hypothetical protein BKK54_08635 [Rodentibacter genomosp. 1]|uniref:Uncharacterized protein n=1 Tax=Rodentibacter genomosp. 1 TaxID=1908264 RepID=A0A1V3J2Y3_9PAST|nr:DUF4435 domain-containing protein [Rodentibacter genomosp. 1]OOF49466.1 hypothetical protein BKK54_08635 [Rodentibacter genomosp. 1]